MGTRSGRAAARRVEGTGCYGAALTRYLRRHDITVLEVNRPDRATRRRQGKTDTIDATAAAHAVLSNRATTTANTTDGSVEMLRMFKLARASAVKSRTQAINQLKAVIVNADPALRETLTSLTPTALIRHCATLPPATPTDVTSATAYTLRRLAQRIQALTGEAHDLELHITAIITAHAPQLLQRHGIGPDSAAALLITAGDNPDRMTSEASFAALCGVSPLEASSGKTRRRRLNRGGDRRANAALYRIALSRSRCDQRTRAYLDKRAAQGHDPPRSHPLHQTLHRPRGLPTHPTTQPRRPHPTNRLTNTGASARRSATAEALRGRT